MYKVKIGDQIYASSPGEKLSELFQRCGIESSHPCAGRGSCKKCLVLVNGKEELSCSYVISDDIEVELRRKEKIDVTTYIQNPSANEKGLFYALDLGTTTLSLALVDTSGNKICQANASNPQSVFGGDVISRIAYCQNHGVRSLQRVIIQKINEMTDAIGYQAEYMYVAGNVTMLHLLLGEDCTSIGHAPYTPRFLGKKELSASELSIKAAKKIVTLPSAHSFVGADVIAGLGYLKTPDNGKYAMLLDLGTNAELVLFSKESIICTAAAAGPCFEGANICCGKSAIGGAISSFSFCLGKPSFTTVNGGEADGICATGLVDTVAALLSEEIIDEGGYMEETFHISDKVYLTQGDVRELQLAKSAICSAIEALMSEEDIEYCDIERLYVSGGFSQKLSSISASAVGLIPKPLLGKYISIGNSSLEGIIRYVTDKTPLELLSASAKYTDLTQNKVFLARFIENMSF